MLCKLWVLVVECIPQPQVSISSSGTLTVHLHVHFTDAVH